MLAPERVLCLIAHPDDLEPQAGGTIIRLVNNGAEVVIIHAITPELDAGGFRMEGHSELREAESRKAAAALGASDVLHFGIAPDELTHTQSVVQRFDRHFRLLRPDLVISHNEVDTQQDHVVMARIAQTLCRRNTTTLWQLSHSFPGGYLAHRPQPNFFVDITAVQPQKMAAVKAYQSQVARYSGMFDDNWLQIIEARDRYYGGLLNQDGHTATRYAEGFIAGHSVWT